MCCSVPAGPNDDGCGGEGEDEAGVGYEQDLRGDTEGGVEGFEDKEDTEGKLERAGDEAGHQRL